jgi:uroporphyrinogen-III synthase
VSFKGATVLAFESRRAKEIGELIRINGGEPLVAPALIEVPFEENADAFAFADRLYAAEFDMLIFLTGVGTRYLRQVISTRDGEARFAEALRRVTIVARGPKPTAVLREWNVPIAVTVPEPNTWRELLAAVAERSETSVAVQEYGRSNPDLIQGLEEQGRRVTRVPVYRWALPGDTGPLASALEALLNGRVQAAVFTTGVQIEHFVEFAEERKLRDEAVAALRRVFVASIGPDCSESLRECGITPGLEPSHPKMGILVREAAQEFESGTQTRATGMGARV